MAEEEAQVVTPAAEEAERPQTAVKDSPESRKVPGGFGIDDLDDLSPDKQSFEDSIVSNAQAHEENSKVPAIDPASLPSLPPPCYVTSLFASDDGRIGSEANMDTLDEEALTAHLNNVESSFIPVASPIGMSANKGEDDTYLFDRPQAAETAVPNANESSTAPESHAETTGDASVLPPTSPTTYHTPASDVTAYDGHDSEPEVGDSTSSLEAMSSPTAAAVARSASRAESKANVERTESEDGQAQPQETNDEDNQPTPRKRKAYNDGVSERSTVRHVSSSLSIRSGTDAGSTPGAGLLRRSSGRRPKYLRGRQSHNSSVSSFVTSGDDGTEVGADYALQSGGAIPANGYARHSSYGLSRQVSLGSMASGIDDYSGSTEPKVDMSLATLSEEEQNRMPPYILSPLTPRASLATTLTAPTDTVIAKHVRDVQVPDALAQEYRNKHSVSPKRPAYPSATLGSRGGKNNMTLKEQGSTIERLSKENFDLKLKIMFLTTRLDKVSEEGVKEMISENVEMRTALAVMQRDNKALKKKVKDLEKQLQDDEERPSTVKSGNSEDNPSPKWFDQEGAQEREEEIAHLRERIEEYQSEVSRLNNEVMHRENEKRNLAEIVGQMSERRGHDPIREEIDVWKDLYEQEQSRREQNDEELRRLREEVSRMKNETASSVGIPGLTHTTNIYNITKKRQISPSRPNSEYSNVFDGKTGNISAATTLVTEIQREVEHLRHENAELRREVGAQTSMLASRNKEKDRLYQEIEDLKVGHRRPNGSIAGDSILDRSISRAHMRSASRASNGTRLTDISDAEREAFENQHAELRDTINRLKLENQELKANLRATQEELETCELNFNEMADEREQETRRAKDLEESLQVAESDLQQIGADRDTCAHELYQLEIKIEDLQGQFQDELDSYANFEEESNARNDKLEAELKDMTDDFHGLQVEMRNVSQMVVRLEDDSTTRAKRIQDLEAELEDANKENEQLERDLVQANEKGNRLTVQQENLQGELAFMREEQESDKLRIGELETALHTAQHNIDSQEKQIEELEQRLDDERHQSEMISGNREREVQQHVNDLNRELSAAKDEVRMLNHSLRNQQIETAEWKQRLVELEDNLRVALGDLNGTRSTLLGSITKLQRELEDTCRELDHARQSLSEKDRIVKQRDSLLESHALESRKLADMLDKERQSHRSTKHQFETFQKTQQHTTRTLSQQESRVLELETARANDRRKIVTLENNLKEQMHERNQLLLSLWNRLSALCGSDWAHNNSLINGRALPSLEAVSTMLPGFAKNLMAAVKTVESLVGDFRSRIRSIEKDLWKEYQALESNLEARTKQINRLEGLTKNGTPGPSTDARKEVAMLRTDNKALKAELSSLRAAESVRAGVYHETSPSPFIPTGPGAARSKSRHMSPSKSSRTSTLTRHQSASVVETLEKTMSPTRSGSISSADKLRSLSPEMSEGSGFKPDLRWQIRLQELEYKLKAEREARLIDRSSARQRLDEKDRENRELVKEVERVRVREDAAGGMRLGT